MATSETEAFRRIRDAYEHLERSEHFKIIQDEIEGLGQKILTKMASSEGDPYELGKLVGSLDTLRQLTNAPKRLKASIHSMEASHLRGERSIMGTNASVMGGESPDQIEELLKRIGT